MPDEGLNEQVYAGGRSWDYRIQYSRRARRMRMTLSADGNVTVTLPDGMSRADAADFVRSNLAWIERTRFKLSLRQRRKKISPPSFPLEFHFPLSGEHFTLHYEWSDTCWIGVREEGSVLLIVGRVLDPDRVHEALKLYLIRKAERVLEPLIRTLASENGFRAGKITIRFQRGRWGSCSRAKDISLNAQMLFLSPEAVRYVLIHELCHTREMNHSARFWREVERYCPDYRQIRSGLKQSQPELWS